MHFSRIIITRNARPKSRNINEELQWLGASLGLFGLRDKDKSCFRLFIVLIKHAKRDRGLSSDELAAMLSLTRGTVVHHLNKLMDSGLVVSERGRYALRMSTLRGLIEQMRSSVSDHLERLERVAQDIDDRLRLE